MYVPEWRGFRIREEGAVGRKNGGNRSAVGMELSSGLIQNNIIVLLALACESYLCD